MTSKKPFQIIYNIHNQPVSEEIKFDSTEYKTETVNITSDSDDEIQIISDNCEEVSVNFDDKFEVVPESDDQKFFVTEDEEPKDEFRIEMPQFTIIDESGCKRGNEGLFDDVVPRKVIKITSIECDEVIEVLSDDEIGAESSKSVTGSSNSLNGSFQMLPEPSKWYRMPSEPCETSSSNSNGSDMLPRSSNTPSGCSIDIQTNLKSFLASQPSPDLEIARKILKASLNSNLPKYRNILPKPETHKPRHIKSNVDDPKRLNFTHEDIMKVGNPSLASLRAQYPHIIKNLDNQRYMVVKPREVQPVVVNMKVVPSSTGEKFFFIF
jgi:hypothetical protein